MRQTAASTHLRVRGDAALGTGGAQAEAVRVPLADGMLVKVDGGNRLDDAMHLSLRTLSDVYGTGWHCSSRRVWDSDRRGLG